MLAPVQWTLDKIKAALDLAKDIRRPMTFYVAASAASFWMMWTLIPDGTSANSVSIGSAVFGGLFTTIIITCCILVFLFSKERLKVDPKYLDKPADHE